MRLNPASTKASSRRNDVASSAVQPNTFPPNASGPTSIPEPPSERVLMVLPLSDRLPLASRMCQSLYAPWRRWGRGLQCPKDETVAGPNEEIGEAACAGVVMAAVTRVVLDTNVLVAA